MFPRTLRREDRLRARRRRLTVFALATALPFSTSPLSPAGAQQATPLPPVAIDPAAPKVKPKSTTQAAAPADQSAAATGSPTAQPSSDGPSAPLNGTAPGGVVLGRGGSLTVPTTAEVRGEVQRTPGGVAVVDQSAYAASPARTAKDALDFVPGVFVQPKWGEDSRLSIRGSGLSRNNHTRGVLLYMDGIPITTSDGSGDMQEISPTAYRYIEVYKGANGLRYGANALGGAINFVTPTGRDASLFEARTDFGGFGLRRAAVSSGAAAGAFDYFVTSDALHNDGFRQHSETDSVRTSANVGVRINPDLETRFYLNNNSIQQQIPGSVRRDVALASPETPRSTNVSFDNQRNIDSTRFANKTAFRLSDNTMLEVAGFIYDRDLNHPIGPFFGSYIEYGYQDHGLSARLTDERRIAGFANRLIVGTSSHDGTIDAKGYVNDFGKKGALQQDVTRQSTTHTVFAENQFFFVPGVALVTGLQNVWATRNQVARLGAISRAEDYDLFSQKVGLLWDVTRSAQIFANVSKSAEAPTFSETIPAGVTPSLKAQTALTYEIGTRGQIPGQNPRFLWDVSLYHAEIENEFQCLATGAPGSCTQVNVARTIHRGVEAGFSAALLEGVLVPVGRPDRLWLNVAYTFGDFRFDNDPAFGNNQLPGAPRHYLRGELIWRHPSGFYGGPTVEWVPEAFFVDNTNSVKTTAYALYGLRAGYDPGGSWSAYVEARNLADKTYIASASIATSASAASELFEPGDGRAVYGGVKYRW